MEGTADVRHVHAWALTSRRYVFAGHLRIRDGADPQALLRSAHAMLKKRFGFFVITLQVETACLDETGATDRHDHG